MVLLKRLVAWVWVRPLQVVDEGMRRIVLDRAMAKPRRRVLPILEIRLPAEIGRSELWNVGRDSAAAVPPSAARMAKAATPPANRATCGWANDEGANDELRNINVNPDIAISLNRGKQADDPLDRAVYARERECASPDLRGVTRSLNRDCVAKSPVDQGK